MAIANPLRRYYDDLDRTQGETAEVVISIIEGTAFLAEGLVTHLLRANNASLPLNFRTLSSNVKDNAEDQLDDLFIDTINAPKIRALLKTLNGKGNVRIHEVKQAVYGQAQPRADESFAKLCHRANAFLAKNNKLFEIKKQAETIILSPLT